MNKFINTMLHGDRKSKLYVWSITLLTLACMVLFVISLILLSIRLILAAALLGAGAIIIATSFSVSDKVNYKAKPKGRQHIDNTKSRPETVNNIRNAAPAHDKTIDAAHVEKPAAKGGGEKQPEKEPERAQLKTASEPETTHPELLSAIMDANSQMKDQEEKLTQEKQEAQITFISEFDEKKLKKMVRKNKVPQVHEIVMIDKYPQRQLVQVPAVMWRSDTRLYFITIEKNSDQFNVALQDIKSVEMIRNVSADVDTEYVPYRGSVNVRSMFQRFLPEYHQSTSNGEMRYTKTLFRIEPGIFFTNSSVNSIMSVMHNLPVELHDKVMDSGFFSKYFKMIYKEGMLCQDLVISVETYHRRAADILQQMVDDRNVTRRDFSNTVNEINRYHLLPKSMIAKYSQLMQASR
ncbi:MAG: hypothetical protein VZR00_06535 [Lachnospiraceae bacterium]|jgi:hypothetical protein|nr:hypothetical protein [Lachnospiraceae bacterium]MEE3461533.1 hypothetical protein [Lachnospiraceae bacterium]